MKKQNPLIKLHQQDEPVLIANVWDAQSAKIAQELNYQILGTSSHAIANVFGYDDGQNIPFEDLLFMVRKIMKIAEIPVSVDFEAGYSDDPKIVAQYAVELEKNGVLGINLEDGAVVNGKRKLSDEKVLIKKIKAITEKTNLFINARIDTYTTKHVKAIEESIKRAKLYQEAGAHGVFVPLIEKEDDLKHFISEVNLPLNVFASKTLPSYSKLSKLGVKRISHGAKHYEQLMKEANENFKEFKDKKDYKVMLGK